MRYVKRWLGEFRAKARSGGNPAIGVGGPCAIQVARNMNVAIPLFWGSNELDMVEEQLAAETPRMAQDRQFVTAVANVVGRGDFPMTVRNQAQVCLSLGCNVVASGTTQTESTSDELWWKKYGDGAMLHRKR